MHDRDSENQDVIPHEAKLDYESFLLRLDETYVLEKLDPMHRPVGKSSQLFASFCEQERKQTGLKLKLKEMINNNELLAKFVAYMRSTPLSQKDKQVQYLDQQTSKQYQVKFINGQVCDAKGKAIDTLKHKGKQDGYDAFVLDKFGRLFIAPHVKGSFHHSTFTGGDDVLCSGMIKIEKGKVRVINNNSGHYKPDRLHLTTLFYLLECKSAFDDAKALDKKNWFVRGVLSFLMVLGLYRPTPRVQVIGRSNTLVKIAHALQATKFRPFYWLGRAFDESQTSKHIGTREFAKQAGELVRGNEGLQKAMLKINETNNIDKAKSKSTLEKMRIFSSTSCLFNAAKAQTGIVHELQPVPQNGLC